MEDQIRMYLAWKATYTEQSVRAYSLWIKRLHQFVNKSLESITLSDLSEFIAVQKIKYAPKNIEYGMSIIKNYFTFWNAQGLNCLNPKLIRVPRGRGAIRKPSTEDIYKLILSRWPLSEWVSLRNHLILRILHDTGCRISEVLSLDFKNIDNQSALVPTRKTKEARKIFWSEETDRILFGKYLPIRINLPYHDDALFISKYGEHTKGRLSSRTFARGLKDICNDLGIEGITAHSFRHGKAHSMIEKNAPITDIAHILGHKNIQSSMKYLSLSSDEIAKRARKYLS